MGIVVILWIISIIAFFWVWSDATDRHGKSMGCLWGLAVLALGPLAIIAYLIFGRSDD